MAISKAEFKQAFREVASLEFSHIPQDEKSINYKFSDRFNNRMEKLIKAQRKPYWKFISTTSKRAAVIFVAILTLFTAAFSVKAIREPIIKFIKQVYESFTQYSFDGDTVETINKEYIINDIPDGFTQTNKIVNENSIITTYENSNKEIIKFTQQISNNHSGIYFDNENTEISKETVNGVEVEFQKWYDTNSAIWTKDGYFFMLDCVGNINIDDIKKIIISIE